MNRIVHLRRQRHLLTFSVCLYLLSGFTAPQGIAQIITTVAGNGTYGYSGDGGPATNAKLAQPSGVAIDLQGNIYVADLGNNRIRKVTPTGTITTFADGLESPESIEVDRQGNVYVGELNYRVRKITPNGVVTTIAGVGVPCLSYGADCFEGDGGPATEAWMTNARGITLDAAGNLFIADQYNHRIRKVDTKGIITTVAGNGATGLSGDGGPATRASLNFPSGVAVDAQGNLFIADQNNNRIRRVAPNGIITTVVGSSQGFGGDGGPATQAKLNLPSSVAVDAQSNLFITDLRNQRVRKVNANGIITTVAGNGIAGYSGDGGPATQASLSVPQDVAVDSQGNLFIAQQGHSRIRKVTSQITGLAVQSFSLINADTDEQIKLLTPGETLNLTTLPTKNLNIRANTSPNVVGSVVMVLSGARSRTQVESEPPYALYKDDDGDFRAWQPTVGLYTLTATPYTNANGTGTSGTPLTISFRFVNQGAPARLAGDTDAESDDFTVQYSPNPFTEFFTLQLKNKSQDKVPVTVYDLSGRLLFEQADLAPGQPIRLGSQWSAGMYIVQVGSGTAARRYRLVKDR